MGYPAAQCKRCEKVFRATKKRCPYCFRILSYLETENKIISDDGINLSDFIIFR